jgi:hypothetical protein
MKYSNIFIESLVKINTVAIRKINNKYYLIYILLYIKYLNLIQSKLTNKYSFYLYGSMSLKED